MLICLVKYPFFLLPAVHFMVRTIILDKYSLWIRSVIYLWRDGMLKMQDVYKQNTQLGDPAIVEKQLEENAQKLDKLRQEIRKYEVGRCFVEDRLSWGSKVVYIICLLSWIFWFILENVLRVTLYTGSCNLKMWHRYLLLVVVFADVVVKHPYIL